MWINTCITATSFAIMLNGGLSTFFKASRGIRQGDTFFPPLFIIMMEVLNKLLVRARDLGGTRRDNKGSNSFFLLMMYYYFVSQRRDIC